MSDRKVPGIMNEVFLAQSKLRRRKFDECIEICNKLLDRNGLDKAVWWIKVRALTLKAYIDDTELEEEGVAEVLMDENAMAKAPRPGTSLSRPMTGASAPGAPNQSVRPMTGSGRPLSGFARPGTQSSGGRGTVEDAFKGGRPGTSRPMSQSGRQMRLGTQSMLSIGGQFINLDKMPLEKYAKDPPMAKVLMDFIIYHDHNPKKGLELASYATKACNFKDWWWKARLGKCYYQLNMFREAEKQFKSAIRHQSMIVTHLELAKIALRLDQPNTALDVYMQASEQYPGDASLILAIARVYDMLNDLSRGIQHYKRVLHYDSSNVEAIACLASHHFYTDRPEVALRYYRRLLQMGVNNTELWNNLGLCCAHASQYDMTLSCFERALVLADDDNMSDVWYNIGQLAIGIGDLNLAYLAFKIAVSVNPNHAESYNNLGLLELRNSNVEQARTSFDQACQLAPHLFEPFFNGALIAFKLGNCQQSYELAQKALVAYPGHDDSQELIKQLQKHFTML